MFLNKECEYFPCHEGLEDCTYCYCPIYPCGHTEFGGEFIKSKNGEIWDCSNCVVLHKSKLVNFKKNEKKGK